MDAESNAMPEPTVELRGTAPAIAMQTRPFYWSVRRELWENRSIYMAPLAVAGVILLAFLLSIFHLAAKMRIASGLDAMRQQEMIERPYHFVAFSLMAAALLVAIFYCLDALHGERRDRSILFWKSMPVSDLTTVLAKASIPMVVLPLVCFAITMATQWIMLLMSSVVVGITGGNVAMLWTRVPWWDMSSMLFLHLLAIHGFWYAPFYGWLLMVSAWARRATFLWAALPPLLLGAFEKAVLGTTKFGKLMGLRLEGGDGFNFPPDKAMHSMPLRDLGMFLTSPRLWAGLALTALFLAAAVRLRRYREPI